MQKVNWGTKETYGLTERMVQRAWKLYNTPSAPVPKARIISCVVNKILVKSFVPQWMKTVDMESYDDSWSTWNDTETVAIRDRVQNGIDIWDLMNVFRVPQTIISQMQSIAEELSLEDIFTDEGIDPEIRKEANEMWRKYKVRIDLDNPTNYATVRSMVVLFMSMRQYEKMMFAEPKPADYSITDINKVYTSARTAFSKAAEDVNELLKQSEKIRREESFDTIVSRIHEIRVGWRDISVWQKMEETGVINKMVELHKIQLEKKAPIIRQDISDPNKTKVSYKAEIIEQLKQEGKYKDEEPNGIAVGSG